VLMLNDFAEWNVEAEWRTTVVGRVVGSI
jgi:hypothetical protein